MKMTWSDLEIAISKMSNFDKTEDITIRDEADDEWFPISHRLRVTDENCDVLDEGSYYLTIK